MWGGLSMLIFWGAIIALVVWAVQKGSGSGDEPSTPSPLDVARERYARGEISKEEFDQLREDLSATLRG